jgi:hypothetical protein
MTSVLTHLLEEEAAHYIAESARVLGPKGRLFATFFLLNDESRAHIAEGEAAFAFLDADEHVAIIDADMPEEAVAYDEDWVHARFEEHGLAVKATLYGSWSGREEFTSFQDIVVGHRA